jgi:hypothetical protein
MAEVIEERGRDGRRRSREVERQRSREAERQGSREAGK